jgi:hypothetical protein
MNRLNRALVALAVCGGLFIASPLQAQTPAQTQKPATTLGKFIPPLRGTVDLEVQTPKSVVTKNMVVTTIVVRNPNQAPIAGLKCDEVWWSKSRSLVPGGGTYRHMKPLQPGEKLTITIETQKDSQMDRNDYQFSHAWGQVKVKPVKKF